MQHGEGGGVLSGAQFGNARGQRRDRVNPERWEAIVGWGGIERGRGGLG